MGLNPGFPNHDVMGFDVSVHHIHAVKVLHNTRNIQKDKESLLEVEFIKTMGQEFTMYEVLHQEKRVCRICPPLGFFLQPVEFPLAKFWVVITTILEKLGDGNGASHNLCNARMMNQPRQIVDFTHVVFGTLFRAAVYKLFQKVQLGRLGFSTF
jgi:hypothetical protein